MINLSEIFFSLQGESTFSGLPCIFIRLSKCNLDCKYCDTKYAFKTSFQVTSGEILKKIKQLTKQKLVEITGGEPLLQHEVYDLIRKLHSENYRILLETNGSILLDKVPKYVIKIVDIKCPGSGEGDSFLWENLNFINSQKDEIKFVLSDLTDYDFAKDIVKTRLNDFNNIIFSTITPGLSPHLIAEKILADDLGVRLQLQLHKYISIE